MNDLKLVLVHNHKGGTGKTMIAFHLAVYMAAEGQPWTVWDMDPQCNVMSLLTQHEWEGEDTVLVPSGVDQNEIIATVSGPDALGSQHLLVDTPPAASLLDDVSQYTSINEHALVICPVNGRMSIDGAIKVAEELAHTGCRVVLVPNLTDPRDTHAREEITAIEGLADMTNLNVEVFQMAIPRNDKYMREAELRGVPIWNIRYALRTHTAQALKAFCDWVARGAPQAENRPGPHGRSRSSYDAPSKLRKRLWK